MSAITVSGARVRPAHRAQRALAVGAALAAVPFTLWGLRDEYTAALYLVTGPCVAAPLFFVRRAKAFVRACVIVGVSLIPWGVLGVFVGLFLFWPSALVLLLAAIADPRKRPVVARVSAAVGALLLAGVVALSAYFTWHFYVGPATARPHTYRAPVDPGWFHDGLGDADQRLGPYGATTVYGSGSGSDRLSFLEVRFPDDLSQEQRAELKRQIEQLPGITEVELCSVRDCG
ncbi:hypothetical protein ACF059_12185 [Streptomyces sp. NPDC016562]|uniref:hypothetical protein n=1 Tax=Streptomyces sp. NPDC016562 TaxID=3364966 RepID=UPI0036FF6F23